MPALTCDTVLYCNRNGANRTYVGVTNNYKRRLRQHNGELVGGAKATRSSLTKWRPYYVVRGFPDRRTALQLEWRLHRKYKGPKGKTALARRKWQLNAALAMPRFTTGCIPTADLALRVTWYKED